MKIPLLALLLPLLALECFEASLLTGQSRTKNPRNEATREAPDVCLDAPIDLPACNFKADEATLGKPSRQKRESYEPVIDMNVQPKSLEALEDSEELSPNREPQARSRATTIIYKLEGCIPSRLPFVLPICTREQSHGRIVEVRRLFPFKVTDSAGKNPGATLVFPEVDMDQWRRFIQGPWTRPADNEDNEDHDEKVPRDLAEEEQSAAGMRKISKRKKVGLDSFSEKKTLLSKLKKFAQTRGSIAKNIDENDLFSKFPSPSDQEQQLMDGRISDTDSYKTRSSRLNRIVNSGTNDRAIRRRVVEKDFSPEARDEFPYAKAIPYDAEKLRIAKIGSEFPYTRAIPYDPEKLQVARRGSEFPYARAIPYDPKKLEERRSVTIDERSIPFYSRRLKVAETEKLPLNSQVVPFDSSMLEAAKDGGIFPYGKATPSDTSKSLDTMEFSKSVGSEKEIKVPVRHAATYWNTEVPTYLRKLQTMKEEARLENIRAGREIQKNFISTGNDDHMLLSLNGKVKTRIARRAMEPRDSSDTSSASDSIEIPSRWSEFPYSKAIPFDPEKLRRPRSTIELLDSSLAIPRDFPYAKAVPYDPWKLIAIRRKLWSTLGAQNSIEIVKRAPLSRD